MKEIQLESVITCLMCGFEQKEKMPVDTCQFCYACNACKILLKPLPGYCCVFCSYGDVKCPPVQSQNHCAKFYTYENSSF
jgi:hypothetical protein